MDRKLHLSLILPLVMLAVAITVTAQDQARDLSAQSARAYRGLRGQMLTSPSAAGPRRIVDDFLRSRGYSQATIDTLRPAGENPDARTGITHLRLEQEVNGLKVYGTYVRAAVNARGELVSLIENLAGVPGEGLVATDGGAQAALTSVLRQYYPGLGTPAELRSAGNTTYFAKTSFFSEEPASTRVAVPMASGALQTGYLVSTWDINNVLRYTVVGRGGRILVEELRTNSDKYNIFPDHPGNSTQTIVNGPGAGNAESPQGWLVNNTSNTTIGNNVDAYLDSDNNNAPDANGRPIATGIGEFLNAADLTQDPTTAVNKLVAVQNLFYLNNIIHDKLYKHGFTEAAGNFQTNNFGKGGAGNDPVNAEAQDGGGTNNANFSTPSDGSRPRMQMYIWTQTTPRRDGDLDSDIVWHEYGHGLTWRMIGGMSGPLAGAIGEGMSDVLSILANNNDVVGEYSYNRATGIRRYRYANYPLTYGNVTGSSVHSDGEIYAATIWRLWELWQQNNLLKDDLYDALIGGMNFTPSTPDYEAMRDGILTSIGNTADPGYCLVWQAFAQFGIGEGADGRISGGGPFGGSRVTITESFTVPTVCSGGGGNTAPTVAITNPTSNITIDEGTPVTFTATATDTEDGTLTASIAWSSSLSGAFGTGGSATTTLSVGTHTITAAVTDAGGLNGSDTVVVTVNPVSTGGINLIAAGYKVKGLQKADLTWSGATSSSVDIFRNGAKITTVGNSGSYTDNINQKGAATYLYQVCEAGTSNCSNTVTVVF